jgi:hypothetical protein
VQSQPLSRHWFTHSAAIVDELLALWAGLLLLLLLHSQAIAGIHANRRQDDGVRCEIELVVNLEALHRGAIILSPLRQLGLKLELNVV